MKLFPIALLAFSGLAFTVPVYAAEALNTGVSAQFATLQATERTVGTTAPKVPFYSQFVDIDAPEWKKIGCGVTSLAMVVNYYEPGAVSVNTLLRKGIAADAYLKNAGWTYSGLIKLGNAYDLKGKSYDLGAQSVQTAFAQFKKELQDGPVIASVHYKFDPKSTIPHLVVMTGITDEGLSYNDPAAKNGGKTISVDKFLKAWKKRFIVIRPEEKILTLARVSAAEISVEKHVPVVLPMKEQAAPVEVIVPEQVSKQHENVFVARTVSANTSLVEVLKDIVWRFISVSSITVDEGITSVSTPSNISKSITLVDVVKDLQKTFADRLG